MKLVWIGLFLSGCCAGQDVDEPAATASIHFDWSQAAPRLTPPPKCDDTRPDEEKPKKWKTR